MKTREQIILAVKNGRESKCIDGRDYSRLVNYFPVKDWEPFGFGLKEGADQPEPKEITKENILADLKSDLEFAFEKALDQRGLSAESMYWVVKMWLWVLDDDLQYFNEYSAYGLPLLKAVAEKFGFENPIGDDSGSEQKYLSYA